MNWDKKDIISGASCLFIGLLFIWGMQNWPKYTVEKDGKWLGNLYYMTIATTLTLIGLMIRIFAQTAAFRVGGGILFSIFYMNVFIEIWRDPKHWGRLDITMCVLIAVGIMVFEALMFLIQKKKNNE